MMGQFMCNSVGKKSFTANIFDRTVDKYKNRGYTEI